MPQTTVTVFRELNKTTPCLVWLNALKDDAPKAYAKCVSKILALASFGYELRRPHCDHLRDDIFELRSRLITVQYRIFYFFSGKNEATLSHGNTKEGGIDPHDIDLAVKRKKLVAKNKTLYTAEFTLDD